MTFVKVIKYRRFNRSEVKTCIEFLAHHLNSKFWMNRVDQRSLVHNQCVQLEVARSCGLKIPKTIVTNNVKKAKSFLKECNDLAIIKTIGQDDILVNLQQTINTSSISTSDFDKTATSLSTPILLQEKLVKKYEIRVVYIAGKVFAGAMEITTSTVDERIQYATAPWFRYCLPQEIKEKLIKFHKSLNLEFSAVDLVEDQNGNYFFLEANPSGQYDWISGLCQLNLHHEIGVFLDEKVREFKE